MKIYTDLLMYLYLLPAAIFAPVIHESVKALCSARLGDPTPKKKGFLSGNPFKYFEPVGFICILIFGYGWGQPVPTSPMYYKNRRRGVLITYITPTVVNLLVGLIAAAIISLLNTLLPMWFDGGAQWPSWAFTALNALYEVLYAFAFCNVGLALFNLIPVYPLDGARILQLFLKPDWAVRMNHYEKLFQVALLLLLGIGIIGSALDPLTQFIINLALRW